MQFIVYRIRSIDALLFPKHLQMEEYVTMQKRAPTCHYSWKHCSYAYPNVCSKLRYVSEGSFHFLHADTEWLRFLASIGKATHQDTDRQVLALLIAPPPSGQQVVHAHYGLSQSLCGPPAEDYMVRGGRGTGAMHTVPV